MKSVKCNNCNANLSLDENLKTLTCSYCGSVKYLEETDKIKSENYQPTVSKSVEESVSDSTVPARPKVNGWLCLLLFMCYFWPGIVYLAIIESKQKKWDAKYKKN